MKFVLIITYMTLGWTDWEVKGIQKIDGFTTMQECLIAAKQIHSPDTTVQCMEVK